MKQSPKLDCACGVIACLHSILNNLDQITLTEGSILDKFYKETLGASAEDRAMALEGNGEF